MSNYGIVVDADAYHLARGNAAWALLDNTEKLGSLVRGTDYIDQRYRKKLMSGRWASLFVGERATGRAQDREWPRTNAVDYEGEVIPDDAVPIEVLNATYEAALREGVSPGSLSPDFIPSALVTQVTVGPITEKYGMASDMDSSLPNRPVIPMIDEIIAPVLRPRWCYPGVRVV